MKIKEVLKRASEEGASDVHFTAGLPPKMRLSGSLVSMPYESLTGEDTMAAAKEIMGQEQFDHFMEKGEYDMSLSLKEAGRYRVNVFRQQGAAALAFRLVRSEIPSPEELGIPSSIIDLYNRKRAALTDKFVKTVLLNSALTSCFYLLNECDL